MSNKNNTNRIASHLGMTKADFKEFHQAVQSLVDVPNLSYAVVEEKINQFRQQNAVNDIVQDVTPDDVANLIDPERQVRILARQAKIAEKQARLAAQQAKQEEDKNRESCVAAIIVCINEEVENRQRQARDRRSRVRERQDQLSNYRKKSAIVVEIDKAAKKLRADFAADLERRTKENKDAQRIAADRISAAEKALDGFKKRIAQIEKARKSPSPESVPTPVRNRKQPLADKDLEDPSAVKPVITADSRTRHVTKNNYLSLQDVNLSERLMFWDGIYKPCVEAVRLDNNFSFSSFQDKVRKGTSPLAKQDLAPYIACYCGQHYHKLRDAFESTDFFSRLRGKRVEICDWGCGQAVATCVLLDYLLETGCCIDITRIILIEPSLYALEKGVTYVEKVLTGIPSVKNFIRQVNKRLNDLEDEDVETSRDDIKIHLFANILDVFGTTLPKLVNRISRCSPGENRFICTSPDNIGKERLTDFQNCFAQQGYDLLEQRQTDQRLNGEYFLWRTEFPSTLPRGYCNTTITRVERQFTVTI